MSKKLQNPKEKLAKYLANIGFASRRNISNFIKNNEVRVNNKKSNHDSIIKDGDILALCENYKNSLDEIEAILR